MGVENPLRSTLADAKADEGEVNALSQVAPKLWAFLSWLADRKKYKPILGEVQIIPVGNQWKVVLKSHQAWRKLTFYCDDLLSWIEAAEHALGDGNVPLERFESMSQKKDPDMEDGKSS